LILKIGYTANSKKKMVGL